MSARHAVTATEFITQLDEYVSAGRDEEAVALWGHVGRELWPQMNRDERAAVLAAMKLANRFAAEPPAL